MILLEGNIGAGKTTVGSILRESGHLIFVEEPVDAWQGEFGENLLQLFYDDPKRWAFAFQLAAFKTRARIWTKILEGPHNNIVLERSIFCDRYVFARNGHENGSIGEIEWKLYLQYWDWIVGEQGVNPQAILYLRTPAETCLERIKERGRGEEKKVSLGYLKDLEKFHDDWLKGNPLTIMLDGECEWDDAQIRQSLEDYKEGKTGLAGCTFFNQDSKTS